MMIVPFLLVVATALHDSSGVHARVWTLTTLNVAPCAVGVLNITPTQHGFLMLL